MNVFELFAKISLDTSGFNRDLRNAEGSFSGFGSKLSGIASGVVKGVVAIGKAGAAAVGVASTAIVGLAGASASSYAEIEQLRGGVQKLFGAEDAKTLIQNANNAFATAGMSAQQYMNQATSFSAALINDLGGDTAKAVDLADVAMRAMSDNYNTFGGDMQNIQNAFQGFAKQNYVMLDNLNLGYGGTKTEMQRLIADANEYAASIGQASDLSIESFADIVTAIDLIQQKQNIAGTTSKEAATTVSGSIGAVKAAWENLVAGFSDPEADLGTLMSNVVSSAEVAFSNLLPVIEKGVQGIASFIESTAPIIAEKLPGIVDQIAPTAINAATTLIGAVAQALPGILQTLFDTARELISTYGQQAMDGGLQAMLEKLPDALNAGTQIIEGLAYGMAENFPKVAETAMETIGKFIEGLSDPDVITKLILCVAGIITTIVMSILDNLDKIIDAGIKLTLALVQGILNATPQLLAMITSILGKLFITIVMNYPRFVEGGAQVIGKIVEGIASVAQRLLDKANELMKEFGETVRSYGGQLYERGVNLVQSIGEGIGSIIDSARDWGRDLIDNFIGGIYDMWDNARGVVEDFANMIADFLAFSEPKKGPLSDFHTYAPDMMELFAEGIKNSEGIVQSQIKKSFDLKNAIVDSESLQQIRQSDKASAIPSASTGMSQGFVQNLTFNSPQALDPSEIARQTRNATRNMILQLRMA